MFQHFQSSRFQLSQENIVRNDLGILLELIWSNLVYPKSMGLRAPQKHEIPKSPKMQLTSRK